MEKLLFAPFSSLVSPAFWGKLDEVKVEVQRLKEDPIEVWGFLGPHDLPDQGPILSVDNTSFERSCKPHYGAVKVGGYIQTTVSAEQFKAQDYNEVMRSYGTQFLGDLFSEEGLKRVAAEPRVLGSFFILTYADLKKFKFLFWFGFPAVSLPSFEFWKVGEIKKAEEVFEDYENSLGKEVSEIAGEGFFVVWKRGGKTSVLSLKEIEQVKTASSLDDVWFGFVDTSSIPNTPSWVLRNYLVFVKLALKLPVGTEVNVFSFRPGRSVVKDSSCIFRIVYRAVESNLADSLENAKFTGWERNDRGTFGPKHVDAAASMDPMKLAENSVDFNLKLMKWRLFPDFDLKLMHKTKCLIIGSGTLGCNVARCLMGWGIRHITFVDNGHVSYSNPVRQSLYTYEDCLGGGKGKAEAAADSLIKIFPGMKVQGEKLMIPMPGHPVSAGTIDQAKKDYERLEALVKDCDVMFLLMDTRESRWLPTVLGAKYQKIVINAALGFDSYLVMRHGMIIQDSGKRTLGCYYCTDVVAPGDSTKDRTLDQQCTVTRPGVSMIAGALAVELLTALLHHPAKGMAPAISQDDPSSPLGVIPHSIRGFLCSGEQIAPAFQAYDKCTACSEKVIQELNERGFNFITDVLNSSSEYLEKLTGLDKLKDIDSITEGIIELSDDEEFEVS